MQNSTYNTTSVQGRQPAWSRLKGGDMIGGYRWPAHKNYSSDAEDIDYLVLNISDGYEMMVFINDCADKWGWQHDDLESCKKLERIILFDVPDVCMSRNQIRSWIETHFKVRNKMQ